MGNSEVGKFTIFSLFDNSSIFHCLQENPNLFDNQTNNNNNNNNNGNTTANTTANTTLNTTTNTTNNRSKITVNKKENSPTKRINDFVRHTINTPFGDNLHIEFFNYHMYL